VRGGAARLDRRSLGHAPRRTRRVVAFSLFDIVQALAAK
jgi:hypothetical protein